MEESLSTTRARYSPGECWRSLGVMSDMDSKQTRDGRSRVCQPRSFQLFEDMPLRASNIGARKGRTSYENQRACCC